MFIPSIQNKEFVIKLLSIALTAGVTVATIIFTAKFVGPIPLTINSTVSQKQNLFTSVGKSEIETVPNQAEVTLGINVAKLTVILAQDEANQVINSVSEKLRAMGIKKEDIKTQNYSIYLDYSFEGDQRTPSGYRVTNNLRVKVKDFDNLNAVIDMATEEGINQVGGIQFSLSKDKEAELKKQARKEAIEDAKDSAQELAKLSGVRLGRVVDASESGVGGPIMYAKSEMMAMDSQGGRAPTNLEPGNTTYEYNVVLSYETL